MNQLLAFLDAHESTLLQLCRTGHGPSAVTICQGLISHPDANLDGLPELLQRALQQPQGPSSDNDLRQTRKLIRRIRKLAAACTPLELKMLGLNQPEEK